jgi:lipoyl(octanoyl) transferase
MNSIRVIDVGLREYEDVLLLQEKLFNENIEAKLQGKPTVNYLILCEHQPVFTLGKSGKRENILVADAELKASLYHVNRGGDVTFHGPGQLVVYPILDLDNLHTGLASYIHNLEQVIIETLHEYGLNAERIPSAAGIWLRNGNNDRKICAIGVKASRSITMHGLAININTDLSYFDKIIACGLIGKATTSLQKETGRIMSMADYKQLFITAFCKVFNFSVTV